MATNAIEQAWNKTRGDNPEFQQVSPDFRAKLQQVYGAALAGGPESGIAGLEEFEREIRAGIKNPVQTPVAQAGAPTLRDPAAVALGEQQAEPTPKGSGAQEPEKETPEKAKQDAAAKNASVEHDEAHSPSFPSAARPLGAESPGNQPQTDEEREAAEGSEGEESGSAKRGKLPADFPGHAALEAAGVTSYGKLRALKGDYSEVPGVGDATAAKIKEALGEEE